MSKILSIMIVGLATFVTLSSSAPALAQSGSRQPVRQPVRQPIRQPSRQPARQPSPVRTQFAPRNPITSGSGSRATPGSNRRAVQPKRALEGYCSVCLKDLRKWVAGNPAYQTKYDGKTYYFTSDAQRKTFLANPTSYAPVLGGDCVTCFTKMRERVPGNIRYAANHQGRLYLLASKEQKQLFMADPDAYANVDLALGGDCPVCHVDMQKNVPGNANVSTTWGGLRYLFPSDEQRATFLSNPTKYVPR